ncbi:MAG: hypothetical protein A2857_01625 [Candidatus Levybacteria bacterium RIFCSPHIGHO2_01_FULL_36_15]|nr:MAG: hypothetical protein A2857_01625 [Candidatus Levybacteria bacterium RIFCSPHIGHO2_01_FULL_36_15]OGH38714.1 MAG: hypothetical protein A2905_00875 [Candidatus Levybacteria bacterium RIFCSPLOWO2_01_FULL_36_10]
MFTSSIYIFLTFLGSLFLLIFTLVYLYYLYRKEREFEDKKAQIYQKSQEILEQSYLQAKDIIEEATKKARETLSGSQLLKEDIEKGLADSLKITLDKNIKEIEQISGKYKKSYENLFEGMKDEYLSRTKQNMDNIIKKEGTELDEFTQVVERKTVDTQKNIEAKISEELQKVHLDIEAYKKEQTAKIDQSLSKIILKISSEILPKTLRPEDHEKIILQALDQAKKDGLFN